MSEREQVHEMYYKQPTPEGLEPCPVCGSQAQLWKYIEEPGDPARKFIACSNGEAFGPQETSVIEGCLLYMPPRDFYCERKVTAIQYWNAYAKALVEIRTSNTARAETAP